MCSARSRYHYTLKRSLELCHHEALMSLPTSVAGGSFEGGESSVLHEQTPGEYQSRQIHAKVAQRSAIQVHQVHAHHFSDASQRFCHQPIKKDLQRLFPGKTPQKLIQMSSPLRGKLRHTSPSPHQLDLVSTPRSSQDLGQGDLSGRAKCLSISRDFNCALAMGHIATD